jgi:putative flippase GtrA
LIRSKTKAWLERYAEQVTEIIRYYQVGIINTLFGVAMYSLFVYLGVNLFAAQLSAHVLGVIFNYFMFRQHVFKSARPNVLRFIGSYTVNYGVSLAFLALFHRFVASPYGAGFLAMAAASVVNYFMLKRFVFRTPAEPKR